MTRIKWKAEMEIWQACVPTKPRYQTGSTQVLPIFDGAWSLLRLFIHNGSSSGNNANHDNEHDTPSVRKWYRRRSFYYLSSKQTSIFLFTHRNRCNWYLSVKAHGRYVF